jgi:hypothetical protein
MAVNPALVKVAVQAATSKDGRKIILISILIPVITLLLIVCFFSYILLTPFQFLIDTFTFSDDEKLMLKNTQEQYTGYIQFNGTANPNIIIDNAVLDRGGLFPYPTNGTTGSRGFSAVPVKHPVLGISRPHWGQDFNTEWHSNVYAVADGKVVRLAISDTAGMYLVLYHNVNGKQFYTRYLHLSAIHVTQDSMVKQGDVIASEGGQPNKNDGQPYDQYPGTSTGHHLHFEVREGSSYDNAVPVDPKLYIDPVPVRLYCSPRNKSITIYLSGGRNRGYEISINNGASWTTAFEEKYTINGLNSGSYSVIARDASYTKNTSEALTVHVN